mgnify:CR=1 FL=1
MNRNYIIFKIILPIFLILLLGVILYNIEKNPLPWMDEMLNAVEHTNFFEGRATEYSRAATTGSWSKTFESAFGS